MADGHRWHWRPGRNWPAGGIEGRPAARMERNERFRPAGRLWTRLILLLAGIFGLAPRRPGLCHRRRDQPEHMTAVLTRYKLLLVRKPCGRRQMWRPRFQRLAACVSNFRYDSLVRPAERLREHHADWCARPRACRPRTHKMRQQARPRQRRISRQSPTSGTRLGEESEEYRATEEPRRRNRARKRTKPWNRRKGGAAVFQATLMGVSARRCAASRASGPPSASATCATIVPTILVPSGEWGLS
jgi:hypothetical protein